MKTKLDWAPALLRRARPLGRLRHNFRFDPRRWLDLQAIEHAERLRNSLPEMSGTTGTWAELMYANGADFTAVASTAVEASLLGGQNDQPTIGSNFFFNKQGLRRSILIEAQGILGTTSTPTIIFQARLGTTVGSSSLAGASIGVSATITTASGVTNQWWKLRLLLTCTVVGQGTNNSTLAGAGEVTSPGGFASPFIYPLEPTTPPTATWTQTFDSTLQQYLNLSVTWGTSSASNTITAKQLWMWGLN